LAVTGIGSVSQCGSLSQLIWLLGHYDIACYTYLLTYLFSYLANIKQNHAASYSVCDIEVSQSEKRNIRGLV